MALIPGIANDWWELDGLTAATPSHFARKLDGLRATTTLRSTGTEVPGRAGLSVRHDMDVPDQAELSFVIFCSDMDGTGQRAGTDAGRRQQVENNVRALMAVLSTVGRKRTVRHIDTDGRWWSAPYRVEEKPKIEYGSTGMWAEVTVTITLPGGYLVSENRSQYTVGPGVTEFTVPGSNGPLVDMTFSMAGAAQDAVVSDQVGLSSIIHNGPQSGTWSVDVGAFTAVVGSTSVIATIQTYNTVGGQLLSVLPGVKADGSITYKVYASKTTALWARGTRL